MSKIKCKVGDRVAFYPSVDATALASGTVIKITRREVDIRMESLRQPWSVRPADIAENLSRGGKES